LKEIENALSTARSEHISTCSASKAVFSTLNRTLMLPTLVAN